MASSCGAARLYSSTAAAIATYPFEWMPLGRGGEDPITPSEVDRRDKDATECVRTLAAEPEHEIKRTRDQRLLQMIGCMESKGWHVVRYSVVVTG
jgi:hypothetical protein